MLNLALRSLVVLGILWGMVFAVGVAVLYASGLEGTAALTLGLLFALAVGSVQYLISPLIIEWIYRINWMPLDAVDPGIAAAVGAVCRERRMREPRFGVIEDGNPNAFTFGHYPGDARVVVTRGLLDLCDAEERKAVVLHEMGHIVHWDFVVMTIAATVPLLLYIVYRFGMTIRGRGRNGEYIALVAFASYVFYIISQYVVLFLSRVREYYADRYAAEQSRNPNALATALVKIAYGLAAAAKEVVKPEDKKKVNIRAIAMAGGAKSMGIFDPGFGASLALAAAGGYSSESQSYDPGTTARAMRWDLWNPWALVCEISSSHPLPAKRIQALGKLSAAIGQAPAFELPEQGPESYWDDFTSDVIVYLMPLLGLLAGVGVAFVLGGSRLEETFDGDLLLLLAPLGAVVAGLALGSLLRVIFTYPKDSFPERKVAHLVGEVKVSSVRSIPATLKGRIIGRGIPGLYWSEDLVVQDDTGFMVCDYRQPIRLLEMLFGLFRADSFIGQDVVVTGWYRRFPRPFLELWKVRLPDGTVQTCHNWALAFYGSLAFSLLGLVMLVFGLIPQMGA